MARPERSVFLWTGLGFWIATAAAVSPAALDVQGQTLVERHCARCHAVGPVGESPNPQAPQFRRLHERYDVDALGEGLAEGLSIGHGPMPEWRFDPPDVTAILAYLRKVQALPAKARSEGRARRP